MKVLVTGAFGYFGLALVQRLAREHEVIAVGREPRAPVLNAVLRAMPGNVVSRGMCDVRGLTAAGLRDVEAVVHLAGGGAPGGQMGDPVVALRDNVDSVVHIANACRHAKRLLLASSIYVYGPTVQPARESDTLAPDTLYGQLKAVAEAVWDQAGGTALRFSHIWGAGSGVDFGRDGVTERLARAALGRHTFALHGDHHAVDLVHIDDACRAIEAALAAPALPPAINIGGGAAPFVTELMAVFGVPSAIVEWTMEPAHGPSRRALDVTLARGVLGWTPRRGVDAGARGLLQMFSGNIESASPNPPA